VQLNIAFSPDVSRIPSRGRGEGCATEQPQGVGSKAYLISTSLGPTPEDARKDNHIIRARYAPLSPASGFPVSRSQQAIREIFGLTKLPTFSTTLQGIIRLNWTAVVKFKTIALL
jgi:hypothetical protein